MNKWINKMRHIYDMYYMHSGAGYSLNKPEILG